MGSDLDERLGGIDPQKGPTEDTVLTIVEMLFDSGLLRTIQPAVPEIFEDLADRLTIGSHDPYPHDPSLPARPKPD